MLDASKTDLDFLVRDMLGSSGDFPQYAYGLTLACIQAKLLGIQSISALELGVAGGNGILELERLAQILYKKTDVFVDVFGFDLGTGMPAPQGFRDSPYIWQEGFFKMDYTKLVSNLKMARLIIGDIGETASTFLSKYLQHPIGFISFDLDYYSSTKKAFDSLICCKADKYFLPRTLSYFDDTVGPHEEFHCNFTGEMLAIKEFNTSSDCRKFCKINLSKIQWASMESRKLCGKLGGRYVCSSSF